MARILVCDDAMFMRQNLIRILKGACHDVVAEAENGIDCIEKYQMCHPDLVLMDITMPDMNGLDATKKIIELDKNAKIVMVSAMGQMNMVIGAVEAGAKDFVLKPFDEEVLLACIKKNLS